MRIFISEAEEIEKNILWRKIGYETSVYLCLSIAYFPNERSFLPELKPNLVGLMGKLMPLIYTNLVSSS